VRVLATLGVAPVTTEVEVNDASTLVDPSSAGTVYSIGATIDRRRDIVATWAGTKRFRVNNQPGWLTEANGVLHPRGSEYDVAVHIRRIAADAEPVSRIRAVL